MSFDVFYSVRTFLAIRPQIKSTFLSYEFYGEGAGQMVFMLDSVMCILESLCCVLFFIVDSGQGLLWMWGDNSSGQLGIGNIGFSSNPMQISADLR